MHNFSGREIYSDHNLTLSFSEIGEYLLSHGKYYEASKCLEISLSQTKGESFRTRFLLGEALFNQKLFNEAKLQFEVDFD